MAHIIKSIYLHFLHFCKDGEWRKNKSQFFFSYIYYCTKYVLFWKVLRVPLHKEQLGHYSLTFFHYSIFLSLYEDMYLSDEYYVKLPKRPLIFDLGSEVGISATYFKTIYPDSDIVAFEPDPASFRLLSTNIKSNVMKHMTVHNVALANKEGKLPFYIDEKVDGSLTMSLCESRQKKKIMVKVARLSSFIIKRVDLIKMDIEGAELSVLQDLARSGKLSRVNHMIIEYHHHIDTSKNELSKLLGILERSGFGYQMKAKYNLPFQKQKYQDCLIFVYRE